MNCCDYLFNIKPELLNNEVIVDSENGRRYTYRALQIAVKKFAKFLMDKHFKKGATIAIHLYNGSETVIAYLACQYCGFISCIVDPMFKPFELQYYLEDSEAVCLITFLKSKKDIEELGMDISIMHDTDIDTICDVPDGEQINSEPYDIKEDEVSIILYTSGSTSKPKGVMHNVYRCKAHIEIQKEIGYTFTKEDRLVCFVPFSHAYGCVDILFDAMEYGACVVMMRSFQPQKLARLIESEGITHLFGVPTHYSQLLRYETILPQLRMLKAAFVAAAPLNHITAVQWQEKTGIYLNEGYGLSETCTLTIFRDESIEITPGNVGKPATKAAKVEIADEEGRPLGQNEVGEIRVKGPNVMLGYWNKPEETGRKLREGWFYTGDFAYKNDRDEFVLCGRNTEFINVAGIKVSPVDVEAVLNQHPHVSEAAVVSQKDEMYGEVVRAFVVLKQEKTLTERELIRFVSSKLSSFSVPRSITYIEGFPRNNIGKIDKNVLSKY
ncbi:long-chain acyl-CoA synthetase [Ruminiclostridium sufflavum DSM 19573]|uniref:Long-chain acyl-CoA synthetase n=1 Tax=Ruminiclostridium sufflavum DSM 19573 TaxID=1121337 RepID=A0A318XGV0_9FIRM|nr:AMP-binding protein [Ruminiclostridium sufflavum]PYG85775.1 long-chain acyl-CoA synthetase [Ruminiclostridium sufflavum DSM 19573]